MYKKRNMQPMEEFVTKDIAPEDMAEVLDEVSFDYARRWLMDEENCPPFTDASNNLYLLRELRDVFRQMTVKEE